MHSKTRLSYAIRRAILIGTVSSISLSTNVFAQDSEGAQNFEKISVTGSRIKRSDTETASPVTMLGADDIAALGATSVDGVLQKLTAMGGAMTNPGINNGSGGNASIDLRGLGSQRTLVLVNGRRMINSGTGAASTVDLNTIPVSMIARIEVLKDGASAVYGTDAVAGVVNVILKDDFEGLEANYNGAISGEGDAQESSFDITLGGSSDRGNFVLGIQYTDRGDASQADRKFSECPLDEGDNGLFCAGSDYAEGGHIWNSNVNDKKESLAVDNGISGLGGQYHRFTDADRFNFSQDSYLFTPMERLNLTGIANYELNYDTKLFAEFTYTKRWSEQQMAPQPVWFDFEYTESMGDALLSQTWDQGVRDEDGEFVLDAQGNPVFTETNYAYGDMISYGRRMSDTGTRDFSQVVDTVRAVIGAEGAIGEYYWDFSANFGRNDSVDRLTNLHNMGSIQDDIATGAFNPIDQAAWTTENMQDYLYTEQNSGGSQLFMLSGSLSGELFELPAGYAGFAAGFEHRSEKAWFIPDSLTAQGLANDPKVEPTAGGFDVNEAYLELALPVLEGQFLAENVEVSAAVRAFDYSTFGSDNTWKLGFTWTVNDQFMFRGVASTAYRAPTVDELYSGNSPSFERVTYPGAQDQAEVTVGGNSMLTPEEAETLTFGLVFEPSFIDGVSMTVDYYNIDISNAIATVDDQFIVDQCLASTANTGTALCQSANVRIDATGRIRFNNQLQNIGSEKTSGVDVNVKYAFEAAGLDWKASLDTTYLDEYVVQVTGAPVDYAGLITSGSGGYADFKTNLKLNVTGNDWDATYNARYIAGMDSFSCLNDDSCLAPSTPGVVYHDLSANYYLNDTVTLRAGVNNLLDKQPPYYTGNNDSNTDPYTYDVLGRRFFAGVNVKL
ncbi:TonB-dependent receptor plug domain-containing protein [Alteromonas aestuariivivens]|uniref:TonB-dependent receptor plug domain-containing protein n=1 Tax=Alteromonas aestuariivivens TaxID=1938339 RepID=UPI0015F276D8|nr:TonB-dependent receptor [Alteromonas aestuariivivens]